MIDTRDKRMSLIGVAIEPPLVMANPDGDIGEADRTHFVNLYAGISIRISSVDTRNKRFSLLAFGKPVPYVLPNPDGTFGANDRFQLSYLYPSAVPTVVGGGRSEVIMAWMAPQIDFIDIDEEKIIFE